MGKTASKKKSKGSKVIGSEKREWSLQSKSASIGVALFLGIVVGSVGFTYWAKYAVGAANAGTCGEGYKQYMKADDRTGSLIVYVNEDTVESQRFCALLVSNGKSYNTQKPMSLVFADRNPQTSIDNGNYFQYAGPVYSKNSSVKGIIDFEDFGKKRWVYLVDYTEKPESYATDSTVNVTSKNGYRFK